MVSVSTGGISAIGDQKKLCWGNRDEEACWNFCNHRPERPSSQCKCPMGQQWENLSPFPGFSEPLPASSSNEVTSLKAAGEFCAYGRNCNRRNRKFGNLRISTNNLVRGGEEDGQGRQSPRWPPRDGIPTSWQSCPWVVSFHCTRVDLGSQQHIAAVMVCHFYNEVIKKKNTTVAFILDSLSPSPLSLWRKLAAMMLGHSGNLWKGPHYEELRTQPTADKELGPANEVNEGRSGSPRPSQAFRWLKPQPTVWVPPHERLWARTT